MNKRSEFPIVIAGGGVVGLATACLLAEADMSVTVLEGKPSANHWQAEHTDLRVVALTRASQLLLERIGAWRGVISRRLSPYRAMQVWDGEGSGEIRFTANEVGEPDLGHIIELSAIEAALLEQLKHHRHASIRYGVSVQDFRVSDQRLHLTLSDQSSLPASLLIAADGAESGLREKAGIAHAREAYQHTALIAQIHCEQPHQQTAWQRFTRSGPLALLPLSDSHQCSIVWSVPPAEAERYLALDDAEFGNVLSAAFEHRLGRLTPMSARHAFPLVERQSERYIGERFALLGDAAHTMHPLAGQGLNLGLQDVECLAEQLIRAAKAGVDPGQPGLLRRFERIRRSEAALMLAVVKGFKQLFTNHQMPLVLARNAGMSLLNGHGFAKAQIIRAAMGLR